METHHENASDLHSPRGCNGFLFPGIWRRRRFQVPNIVFKSGIYGKFLRTELARSVEGFLEAVVSLVVAGKAHRTTN